MTPSDRRPYTASIGMDALVIRADGSRINFGDAIYHPENAAEAREFAALSTPPEPEPLVVYVGQGTPALPTPPEPSLDADRPIERGQPEGQTPTVVFDQTADVRWCVGGLFLAALSGAIVGALAVVAVVALR